MKNFAFSGSASEALRLIAAGLSGISVNYVSGNQIIEVVLWLASGGQVSIVNRMQDVKDRFEVGTLEFTLSREHVISENVFKLSNQFDSNLTLERLVLEEPAVRAESGLVIRARSGARIVIIASAAPCTLSVDFPGMGIKVAASEYPIDRYTVKHCNHG